MLMVFDRDTSLQGGPFVKRRVTLLFFLNGHGIARVG